MTPNPARPIHSRKFAQGSREWAAKCDQKFQQAMAQTTPQTFTLPWPVSTNDLWRAVKGRNILSKRARLFFDAAEKELMAQRPVRVKGRVELLIELGPPTKQVFDLDGKIKATQDVLVHCGVIEDDSWKFVCKVTTVYLDTADFVGARVTITPVAA